MSFLDCQSVFEMGEFEALNSIVKINIEKYSLVYKGIMLDIEVK